MTPSEQFSTKGGTSPDFPHGEARENAAKELLDRTDITNVQKRKMLYDNAVALFGEP